MLCKYCNSLMIPENVKISNNEELFFYDCTNCNSRYEGKRKIDKNNVEIIEGKWYKSKNKME